MIISLVLVLKKIVIITDYILVPTKGHCRNNETLNALIKYSLYIHVLWKSLGSHGNLSWNWNSTNAQQFFFKFLFTWDIPFCHNFLLCKKYYVRNSQVTNKTPMKLNSPVPQFLTFLKDIVLFLLLQLNLSHQNEYQCICQIDSSCHFELSWHFRMLRSSQQQTFN